MFPDDDACAAWLEMRWPDGFVCPACGHEKGWALRRKAHTFECAGCRRQTSVTAGTILHASKLPLTVWWAAYRWRSNGISALQLQKQLGIGSYRSAWLRPQAARQHGRPRAQPLVEIDEASPDQRRPTGGQGRSHDGKMLIVGAIELGDGNIPGRPGRNLLLRRRRPRTLRRNRRRFAKTDAGPATLRSPPIATMSMSRENRRSPRPAVGTPYLREHKRYPRPAFDAPSRHLVWPSSALGPKV